MGQEEEVSRGVQLRGTEEVVAVVVAVEVADRNHPEVRHHQRPTPALRPLHLVPSTRRIHLGSGAEGGGGCDDDDDDGGDDGVDDASCQLLLPPLGDGAFDGGDGDDGGDGSCHACRESESEIEIETENVSVSETLIESGSAIPMVNEFWSESESEIVGCVETKCQQES